MFNISSTTASIITLALTIGLTACGNNKLACNDTEAKDLALEVIHSYTDSVGGFDSRIKPYLGKRFLTDVSTLESNKELGRYSCSAIYNYEFRNKTRKVEISYTLKYLEDKKTSEARVSTQPVRTDYFLADAGG